MQELFSEDPYFFWNYNILKPRVLASILTVGCNFDFLVIPMNLGLLSPLLMITPHLCNSLLISYLKQPTTLISCSHLNLLSTFLYSFTSISTQLIFIYAYSSTPLVFWFSCSFSTSALRFLNQFLLLWHFLSFEKIYLCMMWICI